MYVCVSSSRVFSTTDYDRSTEYRGPVLHRSTLVLLCFIHSPVYLLVPSPQVAPPLLSFAWLK